MLPWAAQGEWETCARVVCGDECAAVGACDDDGPPSSSSRSGCTPQGGSSRQACSRVTAPATRGHCPGVGTLVAPPHGLALIVVCSCRARGAAARRGQHVDLRSATTGHSARRGSVDSIAASVHADRRSDAPDDRSRRDGGNSSLPATARTATHTSSERIAAACASSRTDGEPSTTTQHVDHPRHNRPCGERDTACAGSFTAYADTLREYRFSRARKCRRAVESTSILRSTAERNRQCCSDILACGVLQLCCCSRTCSPHIRIFTSALAQSWAGWAHVQLQWTETYDGAWTTTGRG